MLKRRKAALNSVPRGSVRPSYYSPTFRVSEKGQSRSMLSTQKRFAKQLIVILASVGILAALVVYAILLDPANPKLIASTDAYRTSDEYLSFIKKNINSPLDRSKLTFDTQNLSKAIMNNFPEVSSVNIELPLLSRRPVIRLNIANPDILLSSKTNTILITDQGRAIDSHLNLWFASGLIKVIDQSGIAANTGDQVFSSKQVDFINTVSSQLKAKKLKWNFSLPATAEEIDLHIESLHYTIKMDLSADPLQQFGTLFASIHYFSVHHEAPSQYLDVRIPGKIFYL